jgi:hypothetical protein
VLDPRELYTLAEEQPVPGDFDKPVLVHALGGFIDAGAAGRLAGEHLLNSLEHQVLATFDIDQLYDYRARRPAMTFVEDHWEAYDAPQLVLRGVRDIAGNGFLMLTGPEPDIQWERFVTAVTQLVDRYDVRLSVGMHADGQPDLVQVDQLRDGADETLPLDVRLGPGEHQEAGTGDVADPTQHELWGVVRLPVVLDERHRGPPGAVVVQLVDVESGQHLVLQRAEQVFPGQSTRRTGVDEAAEGMHQDGLLKVPRHRLLLGERVKLSRIEHERPPRSRNAAISCAT